MMMNKEGEKVFIDIYSKLTDSKRYATQKDMSPSNQTTLSISWKTSFEFFLARRVCMITEKDSLKYIKLKELETLLLEQHYLERIIKASISKALKIPQNKLRNIKE